MLLVQLASLLYLNIAFLTLTPVSNVCRYVPLIPTVPHCPCDLARPSNTPLSLTDVPNAV